MTVLQGTINNANPGPTLYAIIETAALALGFTLDDTVVIGGNTHKVLKSAAAGNTQGLDWFLDINYPTTGIVGGMRFCPFEAYVAATDLGYRGAFGHVNINTLDPTTYSRYGATGSALETNWLNTAAHTAMSSTLSATAFDYKISITRDRIIGFTTLQPTQIFYTGFFTPTANHAAHAGAARYPLIMTNMQASLSQLSSSATGISTSTCALTRAPKFPNPIVTPSNGWGALVHIVPTYSLMEGVIGAGLSLSTNKIALAPAFIIMGNTASGTPVIPTSRIGQLMDIGVGVAAATVVRGDNFTLGADTWYTTGFNSNGAIAFRGV